jgi:hypothetical protein
MDRSRLEATATYLSVLVSAVLAVLGIVASADGIFRWDLLPPLLDKVAVLAMVALSILFATCVVLSIVLNVSIVAQKMAAIADRGERS